MDSLLKLFLNQLRDEESDIRNNAVFGLGELALYGGQVPMISLFSLASDLRAYPVLIGFDYLISLVDSKDYYEKG